MTVLKPGNPDFPGWAEGYEAVRPLDEPTNDVMTHLVLMPLTIDRWRVTLADPTSCGEHW